MQRTRICGIIVTLALVLVATVLLTQSPAGAQAPQQTYTLDWWSVDGGGTMSAAGGSYTLGGTAGQSDPGVLTGGAYSLGGGFWRGGVTSTGRQYAIYLPAVFR
jgi:hypothetical protein